MKIEIKVITGAKNRKIVDKDSLGLKIWLKSKPIDGKANEELIDVLSDYYKLSKSHFCVISGHKNKNKIVEINC